MSECAKRTRSLPVSKNRPVDADVVKSIIDGFGAEGASFKDLRIAAVKSMPNQRNFNFDFMQLCLFSVANTFIVLAFKTP